MSKKKFRAAMSVALTFALTSVFALNSVGASNKSKVATRENPVGRAGKILLDTPAGRLLGTGHLTIDGDEAQSGATILSGSTIATGQDGNATIDLNSLGRIELRPNTTIKLTLSANRVEVSLDRAGSIVQMVPAGVTGLLTTRGEHTRLGVTRGEVKVQSTGNARTLESGEVGTFDQTLEAFTSGDAVFTVDGNEIVASQDTPDTANGQSSSGSTSKRKAGGVLGLGAGGMVSVITLTGAATAITFGILRSGSNQSSSTAPRPSRVIP